ncbi:MAG: hypothetical protein NT007_08835 [Candidatus Kapabacteria bacterium]|nr:hypothetical protein [Candidatus Kapabacteria bacterium]
MKQLLLLLFIFIFALKTFADDEEINRAASKMFLNVKKMINQEKYLEAVSLLDSAIQIEPDRVAFKYEKALALYKLEKFADAAATVYPLTQRSDASDQVWQLFGNIIFMDGNKDSAEKIYNYGLSKFPDSGKLMMEIGICQYVTGKKNEALGSWEQGIARQPAYGGNYFHLSKYFSKTNDKIWSVLYGEYYIQVLAGTGKTAEMGKILCDTYNSALRYMFDDKTIGVRFINAKSQNNITLKENSFQFIFQSLMEKASDSIIKKKLVKYSILELSIIRANFINLWMAGNHQQKYKIKLFEKYKELIEAGLFEAYNYTIFKSFNEEEYNKWSIANSQVLIKLRLWLSEHPIELTKSNYFSRDIN